MKTRIIGLLLFLCFWAKGQYTLEEIEALRQRENKPIFILMTTDWCGVCRVQKKNLSKIPQYFWDKVYFISINPEKYHQDIVFRGKKYSFVSNGTAGLHSIAYEWAGGRVPAYPFWVFIDEDNTFSTYEGLLKPEELALFFVP